MTKVYIAYSVTDDDVRVKAVCTTKDKVKEFLNDYDCYRAVDLNKEIPEATWEDLIYKTDMGYVTVE